MTVTWIRPDSPDVDTWRESASCLYTDPDLFFPVGTTGLALEQAINSSPPVMNRMMFLMASPVLSGHTDAHMLCADTSEEHMFSLFPAPDLILTLAEGIDREEPGWT